MADAPQPPANDDRLRHALRQTLESLAGAGVRQLPSGAAIAQEWREATKQRPAAVSISAPEPAPALSAERPTAPPNRQPTAPPKLAAPPASPASAGDVCEAKTLKILAEEVAACTLCYELATTRTQTVFGVGDPQARLVFLGEAPGADEDQQGEPFVGKAGQLLNKILEACRLRREDVYILNILKCRPPGNRNPLPEEAHNCRRFLNRQLQLINPEFICCLGSVAAQNLLGTTETIGKLRGRVHQFNGVKVVCTYHPAYLLRTPSAKKQTWEDMKLLMRELGTPVD